MKNLALFAGMLLCSAYTCSGDMAASTPSQPAVAAIQCAALANAGDGALIGQCFVVDDYHAECMVQSGPHINTVLRVDAFRRADRTVNGSIYYRKGWYGTEYVGADVAWGGFPGTYFFGSIDTNHDGQIEYPNGADCIVVKQTNGARHVTLTTRP